MSARKGGGGITISSGDKNEMDIRGVVSLSILASYSSNVSCEGAGWGGKD